MTQEFIYAYKKMPDDLSVNGASLVDWEDLPEINRVLNGQYRFYGNYSRSGQYRSYLKKGNFIKAKVPDGSWQYFEIYNIKKNLTSVSVTARHIGFMANKNFIVKSFTDNGNGSQIMTNLKNSLAFDQKFNYLSNVGTTHQFTARQVAPVEAIIGSNNGNQNLTGVTSAELDMDNYDLKLVKQIGSDNGFRIDFGINLEAIEEEIDEESIVNSLYLVGGVPDNDYDEDKEPIEYGYLEIDGVTNENRRIAKRENGDCKTVDELIKWGKTLFDNDRIHEPKATHTVSMVALEHTLEYDNMYQELASLHFGDVAHVRAKELDIEIKERMVEYTYFPTLGKYKDIILGNDLSLYTSTVNTQAQELKKKIDNRTETLVQNVLNATAWITGNSGGHVVFRPEKAPSEILIMDTPNVANAKRVWRWNLNGLGYSDNGVNGPFGIAMTSKGEIVADFIKVGTINAEVFETSFNAYGDILKLVKGTLQIWNENKKIMELTKKGMEFWNSKESIGTIGTTDSAGNPFPEAVTPTPLEENSLVIRTNGDGKYILISPAVGKGFVLLGNGKAIYFGDLDVQGTFTVKGKEIDGGNSGGNDNGWNGQYPPEVTTDRDKRYWQIWATAIGAGFTQQAAAALLGNAQGESDANPTADEGNGAPGFGYGVWQWTDSSGATSGRVYMINLMTKAGISDDPDTITAQFKLLMWHAPNGQWIATSAYPYTWTQFMNLTDINTAAQAFVANFERPRDPHPERTAWSQEWYDKFKDLEIPVSKGYMKPIADPITVTSEFGWRTSPITGAQEFHNGIDLVNGNPNTPIFASADGEVIVAGDANYFDWYGNWTVIKHADGMYTGYAHQSRVDVSKGQKVTAGQQIGLMGTTGPSTGEHLHFQFMDEFYPSSSGHFHNARDYIDF
ncbi:TPA: phage tail tip lysozyme [Enterococcus faecium]|uniref:phage tail tip lysozyme n=1 Tax=Enterococcus faecium TaxID=1352 RepID=UPI0007F54B8B|nr:phage tail tip lysozyme [Enterococcus faecium]HAQ1386704.1 peptidoglycan DD-metalloendopeptidase family protein [Enterococcus faecium Ef_aus0057]HAQ1407851.1 peptidoglycan DD-metalloendopeptidase family protein [Enterococcus faecium Ef_aus0050]HAQ1410790.1 peptidoglycan DD-metalloendopeptidase family protein [Enterococcus faecium Ef_aus0030]HAQ1416446.1 peptidoglycan DD-metalloendopeptidase family protein [Enterococcus faecium Ef_aus0018]MDW7858188.1 phage tail tip lysozyme [Enterococcus fa